MIAFISTEMQLQPKFHLGKYIPEGLTFKEIYGETQVEKVETAMNNWHGIPAKKNPFFTDYFARMFGHKPRLEQANDSQWEFVAPLPDADLLRRI